MLQKEHGKAVLKLVKFQSLNKNRFHNRTLRIKNFRISRFDKEITIQYVDGQCFELCVYVYN
jgi:hypothetical protein